MLKRTLPTLIAALGLSTLAPINAANAQEQVANNDYWWPNRLSLEPLRQNSRLPTLWAESLTMPRHSLI